jgi:hypothetical protein
MCRVPSARAGGLRGDRANIDTSYPPDRSRGLIPTLTLPQLRAGTPRGGFSPAALEFAAGPQAEGDRRFESTSLQQTVRLSPAATFERQEPGLSPQVCEARLTTGSAETQQAFHCAPTGGNVSAGPYSSTAVPLMRSAAMPRRSERNQEFPGFSRKFLLQEDACD